MNSQTTRTIVGIAVVVALAVAFWALLLAPKREEASELTGQIASLTQEVTAERARVAAGLAARREFPRDYQELVVLGKAVPGDDETASLLVELNKLGNGAETRFRAIKQAGSSESATEASAGTGGFLLPIGAAVGAAGLPAMPYELDFGGGFFDVADFIDGVDEQVRTVNGRVVADGRLVTIDGFVLTPSEGDLSSQLDAEFRITTYMTPPGEGVTGGATSAGPVANAQ